MFYIYQSSTMSEAIKVVVRVRPMNSKQSTMGCKSIVTAYEEERQLTLAHPGQPDNIKNFAFDHVFGTQSQQEVVYSKTAYDLVENVLLGYNGTIFAYGQTGCGKTHSMIGKVDVPELQGIIPRSFGHILKSIEESKEKEFLLRCSFIQIYNEEVRDLLSSDVKVKLDIKESPDKGVFIKDLSMNSAKSYEDLMGYMGIGNKNRSVGETAMNKDSSRSHLLFMLFLQSALLTQEEENRKYVASKLNLVDLAGSERLSKTGAEGDRLKEAQKINLSLSALGNVISALVDGKSQHIPYRDSKLTRLLQDSLGGNTKTVMIANCSPADYNFDQTLSTLRYASRAKFIKNKPIINEDPKDALLKEYAQELKKLKQMIYKQSNGSNSSISVQSTIKNDSRMSLILRNKEEQLRQEKKEKEELIKKINQLEKMHLIGSEVKIETKIRESVIRASILHRKDSVLATVIESPVAVVKSAKQKLDEEEKTLQTRTNLTDPSQVHKDYKEFIRKLNQQIKRLQFDLKDINHEYFAEKQIILDDLRAVTKENKLLGGISNILMDPEQLIQIKQNASYSQEKEEYKIPSFTFKNKEISLPKIPQSCSTPDSLKIIPKKNIPQPNKFASNFSKHNERKKSNEDSSVRGILNQARIINNTPIKSENKANPMRKIVLEPLKKE